MDAGLWGVWGALFAAMVGQWWHHTSRLGSVRKDLTAGLKDVGREVSKTNQELVALRGSVDVVTSRLDQAKPEELRDRVARLEALCPYCEARRME